MWKMGISDSSIRRIQAQGLKLELPIEENERDLVGTGTLEVLDENGNIVATYDIPTFDTIPMSEAMNYIKDQESAGSRFFYLGDEVVPSKTRPGKWDWGWYKKSDIPKFYGEIEILTEQRAAIITLFDESGEWSGSGRIDQRNGTEESLYEEGYNRAAASAAAKGGRLERFTKV